MIELAIKNELERITGMNAYPLLLPDTIQEGVTFQRISDEDIYSGIVRTGIIAARFQITIYCIDDYSSLLYLDKKIWTEWKGIIHAKLDGVQVQYIKRMSIQQDKTILVNHSRQYKLIRDFIFMYREEP